MAQALATVGDEVLVWAPQMNGVSPEDAGVALSLASLRLGAGAYAGAASLLEEVTRRHDVREAWLSLAVVAGFAVAMAAISIRVFSRSSVG